MTRSNVDGVYSPTLADLDLNFGALSLDSPSIVRETAQQQPLLDDTTISKYINYDYDVTASLKDRTLLYFLFCMLTDKRWMNLTFLLTLHR
jgi:hypothetical protein